MSKKGGYKIIDFGGVNFTPSSPETIAGTYAALEASYGKPILLSGLVVSGTEYNDVYVTPTHSTDYTFTAYTYTVKVTSSDEITITTAE